jgi:oxygen-dependent protoporphyrinogen oxidase
MSRVIVIGAGISGLSSAYYLSKYIPPSQIVILESTDRLGGVIKTAQFGSASVEAGPDSFITRIPTVLELAQELELDSALISPATNSAYIYNNSKLHPIPKGTVFGAPSDLGTFFGNSLISLPGKIRALAEPLLAKANIPGDITVGKFAQDRWGKEVAQILVDPLVGGIHAGSAFELSLIKCAPQYFTAAKSHRSVTKGLNAMTMRAEKAAHPPFYSFKGGLTSLVQAMHQYLVTAGVTIVPNFSVWLIENTKDGFKVHGDNSTFESEKVICATPAHVSANLLKKISSRASALLDTIDYSSPIMTLLAYESNALSERPVGSGVLVPKPNKMLTTAVTFASNKWPDCTSEGEFLFRISSARHGDSRAWKLNDEALISNLEVELRDILATRARSIRSEVHRWGKSLPQFRPFHDQLVSRIRESLPKNLELAGSAYKGVGIPVCISSGKEAAERLKE